MAVSIVCLCIYYIYSSAYRVSVISDVELLQDKIEWENIFAARDGSLPSVKAGNFLAGEIISLPESPCGMMLTYCTT